MTLQLVEPYQETIGINQEAISEWVEFRKEEQKYAMTPRAIGKLEKKILAAGWSYADQQRIADHAMEVGTWKSWYWVDPPKQQSSSSRDTSIEDNLTDRGWAGL